MSCPVRLAAVLAAFLLAQPALAQSTPPDLPLVISPLKSNPDPNGVNIVDGMTIVDTPVILSVPADPRLTFDRLENARPYISGKISHNSPDQPMASSWSAHFGQETSESFQCVNDDQCHSVTYSGANFTLATRDVQQVGSGALYDFSVLQSKVATTTSTTEQRYAASVQYPDGEQIGYTYEEGFLTGNSFPSCTSSPSGNCQSYFRTTRVGSSTGYYITISYQYTGTDVGNSLWSAPAQVALYSPSNALIRRLVYSGTTITDYGNSPTNVGGRVFTKTATGGLGGLETNNGSIKLPGETANQLSIVGSSSHGTSTAPLINSITRDGVAWNYSYTNARAVQIDVGKYALAYDNVSVTGPNGYHVTYAMFPQSAVSYPYRNLIKSRTDALNHSTSFTYDQGSGDRLLTVTMPEGNSVKVTYDVCGNVLTKTSVAKAGSGLANLIETAVYPDSGTPENLCPDVLYYRPISYTDARGHVFNYAYNAAGQLTQELAPPDALGVRRETDISYTSSGISRKTLVRVCGQTSTCGSAAESHTEYTYFGNTALPATVTQKDEATGALRTTTYTYDIAGRPSVIDGPLAGTGDAQYFQYDKFGRKIWEVGELAPNSLRLAKHFTYRDSDDKVVNFQSGTVSCASGCNTASLTLALLQQTDITYDSRRYSIREKTYKSGAPLTVTDHSFLDRGLADCTAVRMNMAALPAATATGACALGTQGLDGADRITKNYYDSAGELTKVQKAYLVTADQADYATYTYTPNGKQQYVTDANGNKAQFTYDGFDRLLKWNFPDKVTKGAVASTDYEQYGYDQNGNRTSLRKRDARNLAFVYDNLNRVTTKGGDIADVLYTYDVAGRQLTAKYATGGQGITNVYNGFGELTFTTSDVGGTARTLTSSYDGAGRRTQLTHPDGQAFTYAYDNLSRLSGVYQGVGTGTPLDTFAFDNNGLISWHAEVGGSSAGFAYDDMGRLTGHSDSFTGGVGNVYRSFVYNPASGIGTETRDNDAYAWTGAVTVNRPYAINGLNQYTSAGSASFTYDANGNLTADGTSTYLYDAENRLTKVTTAGAAVNLIYDPLGRLAQITGAAISDRTFLYDGDAMVAEYSSGGGMQQRYVHGSNAAADDPLMSFTGSSISTATRHWLHADHLGSIVATTDGSGANPVINTYDEYGIPGSANTGRFGYTGQTWLYEIGLDYYKARIYSPTLGRFLQTDPVGYKGGVNIYEYVSDDPINATDPAGEYECPQKECATISSAIKLARQEALRPDTGSRIPSTIGKEIAASLDKLGTPGDHNGVTIANGTLPANTLGNRLGNSITLDFKQIRAAGGPQGYMVGAGVIVHEATHLSDARNGEVKDNGMRFLRERHAFRNQSYINFKMGIRPFGYGFPRWGEDRFWTDLNNYARADCETTDSEHPLGGSCQ